MHEIVEFLGMEGVQNCVLLVGAKKMVMAVRDG